MSEFGATGRGYSVKDADKALKDAKKKLTDGKKAKLPKTEIALLQKNVNIAQAIRNQY